MESDCKTLVEHIWRANIPNLLFTKKKKYSQLTDRKEFGQIIHACKDILSNSMHKTKIKVMVVKRQVNEVAHTLARVASVNDISQVYSTLPSCISHLVFNEMK